MLASYLKLAKGGGGGHKLGSYEMKRGQNPSHTCKLRLMIWKSRGVGGHAPPGNFEF